MNIQLMLNKAPNWNRHQYHKFVSMKAKLGERVKDLEAQEILTKARSK